MEPVGAAQTVKAEGFVGLVGAVQAEDVVVAAVVVSVKAGWVRTAVF